VDEIVCAATPEPFYAVGLWYEDFSETSDEEVRELLARAARELPSGGVERQVRVAAGGSTLEGTLAVPSGARGVVLFAHGSGPSRHSPRNRFVAEQLRGGGLATLLVDLLSAEKEAIDARTRQLRFDIDLLAERLVGAIEWLGCTTSGGTARRGDHRSRDTSAGRDLHQPARSRCLGSQPP
jgi:putative phosphoribosyl transferase